MAGEDDAREAKCPEGTPAWVMTFADLMSLLMCFFVLLLSFSSLDLLKYKQIAGEMAAAFGVQREIKVKDIPKGTSVVKKHFSPGKPEPTSLNIVRQHTTDDLRKMLKTVDAKDGKDGQDGKDGTIGDNTKGGAK
ncbi:MAG: chemotaxis protein MotB, partial [Gammaproteobacteria bacterium]